MSTNLDNITTLFLGGKEKTTLKEMSELLGKETIDSFKGKETIDSFNTSETRGRELSHGLNYQKLGKELMTQDEIAVMDGGKCRSLSNCLNNFMQGRSNHEQTYQKESSKTQA